MGLSGKVALVTGASRGIGRAIARDLAKDGVRVAVHYNQNKAAAEKTVSLLETGTHRTFPADIADASAVQLLVATVIREMGGLDIVVNNAAINEWQPPLRVDYGLWNDVWQRSIDTNLVGPSNVMFWAARHMADNGGGQIVNVSSRGAFRGTPKAPAYGASKAALNAMSQSLAQAFAEHNVYVYVVAPGFVETDMSADILSGPRGDPIRKQSPLNRVGKPEEVAALVAFLVSGRANFATGTIVDVNGASYLRT